MHHGCLQKTVAQAVTILFHCISPTRPFPLSLTPSLTLQNCKAEREKVQVLEVT